MNGDEDLAEDITMKGDKFHYVQRPVAFSMGSSFAQAASKEGSGVRARWVELPDCVGTSADATVPLLDDLSNALIATCKGKKAGSYNPNDQYTPDQTLPANMPADPTYGNQYAGQFWINAEPPKIYDNVIRASNHTFEAHEHHVTQTQDGNPDQTDGGEGPRGDFNTTGRQLAGNAW